MKKKINIIIEIEAENFYDEWLDDIKEEITNELFDPFIDVQSIKVLEIEEVRE